MTKFTQIIAASSLTLALGACVSPAGPIEVTRFHTPETVSRLGTGTIALVAAPPQDPQSLEYRTYAAAVMRELEAIGYSAAPAGTPAQYRAQINYERFIRREGGGRSPVSVGVGGSTGSYGSGLGLGIGLNLGGGRKDVVTTELDVAIRSNNDDTNLWEGRAISEARQGSSAAETSLSASKLATSLFMNFPGASGETVEVK